MCFPGNTQINIGFSLAFANGANPNERKLLACIVIFPSLHMCILLIKVLIGTW